MRRIRQDLDAWETATKDVSGQVVKDSVDPRGDNIVIIVAIEGMKRL